MKTIVENNNTETNSSLHMHMEEVVLSEKQSNEKPTKNDYFSGLKKYFHRYWPTIKNKLNEDVKIEYTGVGGEAFIEMGKKIKKRFLQNATVMVLGQNSESKPLDLEVGSKVQSIPLHGSAYDFSLDKYSLLQNDNSLDLIGTSSGHSIVNISHKNILASKAFIIFISLGSNDPLDEFYQYTEMLESHNVKDKYILVVFLHEKVNQHNADCLTETINTEYVNSIEITNCKSKNDDLGLVYRKVIEKLSKSLESSSDETIIDESNLLSKKLA